MRIRAPQAARFVGVPSVIGLLFGALAGGFVWHAGQLPPPALLSWIWFLGGFVSIVGGVTLLKHSRWLALVCIFGGFVVFFSASLYLNETSGKLGTFYIE